VRSERFQLTGDEVTLSRSPRGVHVEGTGQLAFCNCRRPPITLGFSAADLAPPTDVLLEDATIRVFGVPIFYSPYLWLRAPTKVGVLPPWFAYRSAEGVQVGSGVHVPFASDARRLTAVDLSAYGYSRGGFGVAAEVSADGGRGDVVWDYFEGSAVRARGTFATTDRTFATLGGRFDVLRGERALIAFSPVRDGALRMDRARLSAGRAHGAVFGLSLEGTSRRGSALDAIPVFGPSLEMGSGFALAPGLVSNWALRTQSLRTSDGSIAVTTQFADFAAALPLGPALVDLSVQERASALADVTSALTRIEGEARVRVGAPLARRFDCWLHRVEPSIEAAIGARRGSGATTSVDPYESASTDGERLNLLAGLETALGVGRSAADLRLAGGLAGSVEEPEGVLAARARADAPSLGLSSELRALPEHARGEAYFRAELLPGSPFELAAYADGLFGEAPETALLFHEDFSRPAGPWLSESGWGAGGAATVRIGRHVTAEVAADYDLSRERFLGGSTAVGYRHVCNCLGVSAWAGKRVGRDGFDLAVSVDLVP
jgi:hypothetical protein